MATVKEMIAVMQASEEGKKIEYKYKHNNTTNRWTGGTTKPAWNWGDYDYRVVVEPLELELWYHTKHGNTCDVRTTDKDHDWTSQGFRKIKVKEVL